MRLYREPPFHDSEWCPCGDRLREIGKGLCHSCLAEAARLIATVEQDTEPA